MGGCKPYFRCVYQTDMMLVCSVILYDQNVRDCIHTYTSRKRFRLERFRCRSTSSEAWGADDAIDRTIDSSIDGGTVSFGRRRWRHRCLLLVVVFRTTRIGRRDDDEGGCQTSVSSIGHRRAPGSKERVLEGVSRARARQRRGVRGDRSARSVSGRVDVRLARDEDEDGEGGEGGTGRGDGTTRAPTRDGDERGRRRERSGGGRRRRHRSRTMSSRGSITELE